jgi:hypothetical protein
VFTRIKSAIWNAAMRETTTPTAAPGDEFDRPEDLIEISVNRLEAKALQRADESVSFSEKLGKSVLGQLMKKLEPLDNRALRRAYEDTMDDGQSKNMQLLVSHVYHFMFLIVARAFFVKLIGEGADDHGGPYRAIFQTAISEETEKLLGLFVPCANARHEVGEGRDRLVFNAAFSTDSAKLNAYEFLGMLIGLACRNYVLVDVNLSALVWKPLVGDMLQADDFFATDIHLHTSLEWVRKGEAEDDLVLQILSSYVDPSVAAEVMRRARCMLDGRDPYRHFCDVIMHLNFETHRRILSYIYKGLSKIVPAELFAMFTSQELEIIFCGEPDVNVDVLQEATVYDGVSPTDT